MSFKKWRLGLLVAIISGVFTAGLGIGIGMTVRQIIFFTVANICKDGLLFLQQNPVDKISFDTETIKRTAPDGSSVESTVRSTTIPTQTNQNKTP